MRSQDPNHNRSLNPSWQARGSGDPSASAPNYWGLAGGATPEEVCEEYGIIDADIRAALEYAEELVEAEETHPLPAS